jgi:phenylacetate-CoA ligase
VNLSILVGLLRKRRRFARRDRWSRAELAAHQQTALRALRAWTYERSRFYQSFHRGLFDRPLSELPVLTKPMLMERFDELVTDREVRLADARAHLA